MPAYKCVAKIGHQGAGNYIEKVFVLSANNIVEAYNLAKSLPGVKKGKYFSSGSSILHILPFDKNVNNCQ